MIFRILEVEIIGSDDMTKLESMINLRIDVVEPEAVKDIHISHAYTKDGNPEYIAMIIWNR